MNLAFFWRRRSHVPPDKEAYLRLVGYLRELVKAYKEMMDFLLEKMRGRKEYWRGHAAGLRVKPPNEKTLRELEIAEARLDELSRFLDWLETASNKLNQEIFKISDKLKEEEKRLSSK